MTRLLYCGAMLSLLLGQVHAQTVFQEGDTWAYFPGRSEPPANWKSLDFDAIGEGWSEGPTGIGYGDDDDATILTDMENQYSSLYLWKLVEIPSGSEGFLGILRVRYDDGFIIWVDGREVARRSIDIVEPIFSDFATDHEITGPTGFDEAIMITDEAALEPGEHSFAVQVLNSTLESSDLSFSAELELLPYWVSAVEPNFGPLEGGDQVLILGAGFSDSPLPEVWFGDSRSSQVTFVAADSLRAVVPSTDSVGTVNVTVSSVKGEYVLPNAYSYRAAGTVALRLDGGDFATAQPFDEDYPVGTIETWFRRAADSSGFWRPFLSIQDSSSVEIFRIEMRDNRFRTRVRSGDGFDDATAFLNIPRGEWHHLALDYGPTGHVLFLDGQPVITNDVVFTPTQGSRLRLGMTFEQGSGFQGDFKLARFWGVARETSDIRRLAFARLVDEADLVCSWPLDAGAGGVAPDVGPSAADFLLGGSAAVEDTDPAWTPIDDFPLVAVTDVAPDRGPLSGGTAVLIYGTGFGASSEPRVFFGDVESTSVDLLEPWVLEAVAPEGTVYGPVDVRVETRLGQEQLAEAFIYEPTNLQTPVREGDTWDYYVAAAAPPFDWNLDSFDAAAAGWSSGATCIGYEDGDDATDVSWMMNLHAAVYARVLWELPVSPASIDYLRLRVRHDDGYVAYLNGTEIARAYLDGDPPAFDALATETHEITGGIGQFDAEVDILSFRDLLVEGTNVLAIQVHNSALDSSDFSLSAELVYSGATAGTEFIRGDVDRNGSLAIGDPVLALRFLFMDDSISCKEAADVDNDGELAITDPIVLLRFLFLGGPEPAAPFPDPGTDTDADSMGCDA